MKPWIVILSRFGWMAGLTLLTGCGDRRRSALDPGGLQAERISHEWWFFLWICVAVYMWVMIVLFLAIARGVRPRRRPRRL